MEWIGKIIEAIKVPAKFIFASFLASLVFIVLPEGLLKQLYLADFAKQYGQYVGVMCVISSSLLLVSVAVRIWSFVLAKKAEQKLRERIMERLNKLDKAEKSVIREFFIQGRDTIELPMDHPVVAGF